MTNLNDTKVDDVMALLMNDVPRKVVVERLTATQIIIGKGRWRRDNGRAVGTNTGAGVAPIVPWTHEHDIVVAQVKAGRRLRQASDLLREKTNTWGAYRATDAAAALALAEQIEAYLKGAS